MPLSRSRDYLSIGEVLEAIRAEFPDVSISKIRFLETEGLITPERTSSGYRKFYGDDVARLRHILSLQRDHFLPLRVIRERLLEGTEADGEGSPTQQTAAPQGRAAAVAELGDLSLSREELKQTTGASETQLRGLEDFAVLDRKAEGSYDGNDVVAVRAAIGLFDFGLEPRHMRMFRQAIEREAALVGQIVAPLAQKRDPAAAQQVRRSSRRIVELTRQLREALLQSALSDLL
jgi:DNA-binding transcriptional MerR regulator